VRSAYRAEVQGLEKLLHVLLEPESRAEWYEGAKIFFETLDAAFSRTNKGGFTHEVLLNMPDFIGPEWRRDGTTGAFLEI